MDVREAEEAEVGREEASRVPPCGDELGGEVSHEVRRGERCEEWWRAAGVGRAQWAEEERCGRKLCGESQKEAPGGVLKRGELDVDLVGPGARDKDKVDAWHKGRRADGPINLAAWIDVWRYFGVHQDERRGG